MTQRLEIVGRVLSALRTRNDVINIGRNLNSSTMHTKWIDTEWMPAQYHRAQPPPRGTIAALMRGGAHVALATIDRPGMHGTRLQVGAATDWAGRPGAVGQLMPSY
jgi:hypothetical protein